MLAAVLRQAARTARHRVQALHYARFHTARAQQGIHMTVKKSLLTDNADGTAELCPWPHRARSSAAIVQQQEVFSGSPSGRKVLLPRPEMSSTLSMKSMACWL